MTEELTQPRYVIYDRSATNEPLSAAANSLSALREYAATKGGTIVAEHVATRVSGVRADHKALLSRLREEDCDTLLMTDLAHLGRGKAAMTLIDQVKSLGVCIETPDGPLMTQLSMAIFRHMVEGRAEAIQAGIAAKVAAGHH